MVLGRLWPFLSVLSTLTIRLGGDILLTLEKHQYPKRAGTTCGLLYTGWRKEEDKGVESVDGPRSKG